MRIFLLFTIFISTLFLSCDKRVTEPLFNHQYVIYLVLNPEEVVQEATVDSTYRMNRAVKHLGISGAEVYVVREDSIRFDFREDSQGTYKSVYSNYWVKYNTNYSVNIIIDNDTISENIEVPEKLRISSIGDTISLKNAPLLTWNNSEGCRNYFINVTEENGDPSYFHSRCLATSDTFINAFDDPKTIRKVNKRYSIVVTGYEENASNSIIFEGDYDTIDDKRAIGTIGSFVRDMITVWVTE